METLGSLVDKLSIVKLKQFHTDDLNKQGNLGTQENLLIDEINNYICNPPKNLVIPANKVYSGVKNFALQGTIGELIEKLIIINCDLWHAQEKVYDFVNVPVDKKDIVIQDIAALNIQRNHCMEAIDKEFEKICIQK